VSPLNSQASLTKDEQEQENIKIESNIKELRNNMNKKQFKNLMKVFKTLSANPDINKVDVKQLSQFYCTEKSMTDNFEKVFGYRCDMFAKMLYFDMSR
jgi:hypothetical protein